MNYLWWITCYMTHKSKVWSENKCKYCIWNASEISLLNNGQGKLWPRGTCETHQHSRLYWRPHSLSLALTLLKASTRNWLTSSMRAAVLSIPCSLNTLLHHCNNNRAWTYCRSLLFWCRGNSRTVPFHEQCWPSQGEPFYETPVVSEEKDEL